MNIYLSASIRGGRDDQQIYEQLVGILEPLGTVLTEHIGYKKVTDQGSAGTVQEIFHQDVAWLQQADVVIAEATTPSLGVGYELGIAEKLNKRVLCLFRPSSERKLSAMVAGNPAFHVVEYESIAEAQKAIERFINA